MKTKSLLTLTVIVTIASASFALATNSLIDLKQLARDAISSDARISKNAIETLRAQGQAGLQALFDEHAKLLKAPQPVALATGQSIPNEKLVRLKTALDSVGQQHDCYASKLFWFTDLDQAKAAAKISNKPVLSLRLLGKLDEEFSCANSRFFRTTLYANAEVSQYLRDHFVLHWKSVRPVPRITIDFGDGRKVERTITGNSIHYVLDRDGRVIDALPGLYGPKAFLEGLQRAEKIEQATLNLATAERAEALSHYHRARLAGIEKDFAADLQRVSEGNQNISVVNVTPSQPTPGIAPPAKVAALRAVGKSAVEAPVIKAAFPAPAAEVAARRATTKADIELPVLAATSRNRLENPASPQAINDDRWTRIAALHAGDAQLDASSRELIRAKNPAALDAGRITASKVRVEDPLLRAVQNLERSIAEDTVRNEYLLHATIHRWFVAGNIPSELESLNSKIYAELFLTPDSDPWLGLVPRDTIAALDNNGIVQSAKR